MGIKILDFGSLNIDYTYMVDNIVAPGETVASHRFEKFIGGKGLNQATALKRAGADVNLAGFVGKADGGFLLEFIEEEGIDSLIKAIPGPSGHAIIQIDERGQNSIIVEGGANRKITTEYIEEVIHQFYPGDYLLVQNEINNIDFIIKAAKRRKMKIFLNPSPIDNNINLIDFNDIDVLIINEIEGQKLSGKFEADQILEYFNDKFPKIEVVLTLGKLGGIYAYQDEVITYKNHEVDAIDTTAAGDTFLGFFMASQARGKSIKESLDIASLAAALACMKKGAANSIPTFKEIEEYATNTDNI